MKAVYFERFGGPEVLTYGDRPDPVAGPGEALVRVRACGINHLDLWVRGGLKGLDPEMPHILGNDIVGEVSAVGPGVKNVGPGDRTLVHPTLSCGTCPACAAGDDNLCRLHDVVGRKRNGGYAEWVVVPAANCLPYPGNLTWEQAAAVPLVLVTAWHMLVTRARVQPGEDVLVIGAGSGVGSTSVFSPGFTCRTASPTASISPTMSLPRMCGISISSPRSPRRTQRSRWLIPQAFTSTSASPGPATGSGTSRSSSTSGPPKRSKTMAFIRRTARWALRRSARGARRAS